MTMACWFFPNATENATLMDIADSGVSNHSQTLQLRSGGEVAARTRAGAGGSKRALSTSDYSLSTWQHAAGVWTTTTDRKVYIDGGSEGTDTASSDPANEDRTFLGAAADSSISDFFNGNLAEAAIWDVALSTSEVAALANGWTPLRVRPTALVAYWPLYQQAPGTLTLREEINYAGDPAVDYTLIPAGAGHLVADHAPVRPPFGITRPRPGPGAAAAAVMDQDLYSYPRRWRDATHIRV